MDIGILSFISICSDNMVNIKRRFLDTKRKQELWSEKLENVFTRSSLGIEQDHKPTSSLCSFGHV